MLLRLVGTLWGWGAFALGCLAWGVAVIPVTLALERCRPGARERFELLTSAFLRSYLRSLPFLRLEVDRGPALLEGPRILAVNHQSWFDPLLLIGLEPRVRGPARVYLFRVPVLATILRLLGFFPADSGAPLALERLHRNAASAQRAAGALLFFPEGTRSRSGEVAPFHRGAFRLAFDHELPIQPVVIEGLDRVLPPGAFLIRNHRRERVRVRYLRPLAPPYGEGLRRQVVRGLAEQARTAIADELVRLRRERSPEPDGPWASDEGHDLQGESV